MKITKADDQKGLKKINTVNTKKNNAVTLGCSCSCTCYNESAKMAASGYQNQNQAEYGF